MARPGRAPRRYDVFLSYTSEQRPLVQKIRVELMGAGLTVFIDKKDVHFARSFDQTIREAIEASSVMVFVLSECSIKPGSYALFEVDHAIDAWSDPYRIVTVHADGTTAPSQLNVGAHLGPQDLGRVVAAARRYRRRDPRVRIASLTMGLTLLGLAAVPLALGVSSLWAPQRSKDPEPTPSPPDALVASVLVTREPPAPPTRVDQPPAPGTTSVLQLGDDVTLAFVYVPAGRFTMGSLPGVPVGRLPEPLSHHEVPGYWMTTTEIPRKVWNAVMGPPKQPCKEQWCSVHHPVSHVTYDDAVAFTNALSERVGRRPCYERSGDVWIEAPSCDGIRLPTEVEWEYAARAGATGLYSFGDDPSLACQHANGRDQRYVPRSKRTPEQQRANPALGCNDGYAGLAPVARFQPNAFGLYDMHGNAWEWVVGNAPGGPRKRLLRGGSFRDAEDGLRAAKRYELHADQRYVSVGFRCITRPSPPVQALAVTEGTTP